MNYIKATNFAAKDSLLTGNPQKLVKGTEINSEFDAIATAISSKQDALPTGIITLWSGAVINVPTGWALCDGLNGTPDLRNRFVIGAGSTYAVGATGGSKDAVVVSHSHSVSATGSTNTIGDHTHDVASVSDAFDGDGAFDGSRHVGSGERNPATRTTTPAGGHSHTVSVTGTAATTGESGVDKNLPPYYALAYIMKL